MEDICPKSEKCPIFIGGALKRASSEEVYRTLYCSAGKEKYESCKRFIVSNITGKPVPINIMPNSSRSAEEIIELIKDQQ